MRMYTVEQILNRAGSDKVLQEVVKPYKISGGLLQTIAHHVHRILKDNGYKIIPAKNDNWDNATNDHALAQLTGRTCLCRKCFR
jgi:hypothetical protein